ncbi:lipopolysaccharide biosynthesis protein [Serinicoccus sp. LYQ131]|uniref:lipopolysaccharide biosynthesis protein n=1 Tax=Serinicoccus sp. LYQ131 TaxID=3378797 RepID=UPI003851B93D
MSEPADRGLRGGAAYAMNTASFGLYITAQQLLALPIIASSWGAQDFSLTVLYISIYAVVTNVFGEELGNVVAVRRRAYEKGKIPYAGDVGRLLISGLLVVLILTTFVSIFGAGFATHSDHIVYLPALMVLGLLRTFGLTILRAYGRFDIILALNFIYAIGLTIGLATMQLLGSPLWAFLLADAITTILLFGLCLRAKKQYTFSTSRLYRDTRKAYWGFAFVALVGNGSVYLDRLIILPLLGATAVATYFAASSLAKTVALLINPLAGVLLSRYASMPTSAGTTEKRRLLRLTPLVIVAATVAAYVVSRLGVSVLYPTYAPLADDIYLPASVAAGFTVAATTLRPALMRFFAARWLVSSNMGYGLTLLLGVAALLPYGLIGFAWAVAFSRILQVSAYCLALASADVATD